jgi:hypothetical protein
MAPAALWVGLVLTVCLTVLPSCALLAHSPYAKGKTKIHNLKKGAGLLVSNEGEVPYQKWRIPNWNHSNAYIWLVGKHDFRKFKTVDMIFYFHGMHSKDYYGDFKRELEKLAQKRKKKPFLFVALVDTPFAKGRDRMKRRWKTLAPEPGARPDKLIKIINSIYRAFRVRFPHIRPNNTKIVLAGFSGGGRVVNSVGTWLAQSPQNDRYAKVFRQRLSKIVYFDCWFNPDDLDAVPTLLKINPNLKIVGTVAIKRPLKNARILAKKFKMRRYGKSKGMIGAGGRLVIYREKGHWAAMIERLEQALDV